MNSFISTLGAYTHILNWRDVLEILIFSSLIYFCSLWLKQDRQKKLLLYFYAYFLFIFATYNLNLATINSLLIVVSPLLFMLFILIHQTTLQKNFVGLRREKLPTAAHESWLELIIKTALININNNKELIFVIENGDKIDGLITTSLPFHATIKEHLLDILIESKQFDPALMIWITSDGTLLGMNSSWKITQDFYLGNTPNSWKEEALFFTSKTDTIIFKTNATLRLFELIMGGIAYEKLSADKTIMLIKRSLGTKTPTLKGEQYAPHTHKEHTQQPHH